MWTAWPPPAAATGASSLPFSTAATAEVAGGGEDRGVVGATGNDPATASAAAGTNAVAAAAETPALVAGVLSGGSPIPAGHTSQSPSGDHARRRKKVRTPSPANSRRSLGSRPAVAAAPPGGGDPAATAVVPLPPSVAPPPEGRRDPAATGAAALSAAATPAEDAGSAVTRGHGQVATGTRAAAAAAAAAAADATVAAVLPTGTGGGGGSGGSAALDVVATHV